MGFALHFIIESVESWDGEHGDGKLSISLIGYGLVLLAVSKAMSMMLNSSPENTVPIPKKPRHFDHK